MHTNLLHYCGDSNECKKRLENYFSKIKKGGVADACFYEGDVKTPEEFSNLRVHSRMFLICQNNKDVAHCHFNNFEGLSGRAHFSVSKEVYGESIQIGKDAIHQLFKLTRAGGKPFITSLIGLTPETNRLAMGFIKSIGFKPQFTLKDSCYLIKTKSYVNGLVSLLEK